MYVYTYIYTHIQTYIYTHTLHTYIHRYIHTYMYACMKAYIHTCIPGIDTRFFSGRRGKRGEYKSRIYNYLYDIISLIY